MPEVIADSDDEPAAPSLRVPVDEADTQSFEPDTQAILGPLVAEELQVLSATESPPKPRELLRSTSLGCLSEGKGPVIKEHKFMDLSPTPRVSRMN